MRCLEFPLCGGDGRKFRLELGELALRQALETHAEVSASRRPRRGVALSQFSRSWLGLRANEDFSEQGRKPKTRAAAIVTGDTSDITITGSIEFEENPAS